jgi:hypothetical protein
VRYKRRLEENVGQRARRFGFETAGSVGSPTTEARASASREEISNSLVLAMRISQS